jgi:rare lipoprotein A
VRRCAISYKYVILRRLKKGLFNEKAFYSMRKQVARRQIATILSTVLWLAAVASPAAFAITDEDKSFSGLADYYADIYHGKRTASGALHDKTKFMAAHRTLPFGTKLKIVNRLTKKSCIVVINDRGPFTKNKVIDVSMAAAKELGLLSCKTRMVDCSVVNKDGSSREIACAAQSQ